MYTPQSMAKHKMSNNSNYWIVLSNANNLLVKYKAIINDRMSRNKIINMDYIWSSILPITNDPIDQY